jgi:cytochrome c553
MRALTVGELLDVWECARARPPAGKALALLAAACPESSPEHLASLSIGERDSRLLRLRTWMFGDSVSSLAACAWCHERIEVDFNVSDVRLDAGAPPPETSLALSGYQVSFRPPNSADLAAIPQSLAAGPRQALIERCVTAAERAGQPVAPAELPGEVVAALSERLAQIDPQADVRLDLLCPYCQRRTNAVFDIVSFFWTEIEAWARRTLREVHVLARAYGWSEREILALSPQRRHLYIEMAAA